MSISSNPADSKLNPAPLKKTVMILRIIWAALLIGECTFMAVVAMMILPHQRKPDHPQQVFVWVSFGMLMTIIPVAFIIRRTMFRGSSTGGEIRPAGYFAGNVIFWAACDGVAFFGLVAAISMGSLWPTIVNAGIAMALQVLTFPREDQVGVSTSVA